jgi:hypothetical protein
MAFAPMTPNTFLVVSIGVAQMNPKIIPMKRMNKHSSSIHFARAF